MTITIGGKEYEGAFYSLSVFQRAVAYELKLNELIAQLEENPDDDAKRKEYGDMWLKFCGCQLKGDVSALDIDTLSPEEAQELRFFFDGVLAGKMRKLNDGLKSFAATLQSTGTPQAS